MSDDAKQLALPVDLGSWPPPRPAPAPTPQPPLTDAERNELAESTFALAGVGPPAKDGSQPVREVGLGYLPVGESERKLTAPPIVTTNCECDLRQRRWNPNTGKCETCSCRYRRDPPIAAPAPIALDAFQQEAETVVIPAVTETIAGTIASESTVVPANPGDHAVNCAWQDGVSNCDCNYEGERPIAPEYKTVSTSIVSIVTAAGDVPIAVVIEQDDKSVVHPIEQPTAHPTREVIDQQNRHKERTERTCWPSGSGASFSEDRSYRFALWRDTGIEYGPKGGPVAVIIGVNPSDANETDNDPTITKDTEFAKRWGCAHVLKVNAYGFIATDPDDMRKAFAQGIDIVGPGNDGVIRRACGVALLSKGKLVLAWGKNITPERQKEIYDNIIRFCGVTPMCLGINKDGTPKHTGRIAYATELVPWTCP